MKNYVCRPKKESKKCVILSVAILFLSAVAFFLSATMASFRAVGQMISVVFLLLFVQLSSKFLLTDYFYTLGVGVCLYIYPLSEEFVLYELPGKKSVFVIFVVGPF